MKFKRHERIPFRDTSRKRAFVAIKHRREQEKFPLFSAEIAESQQDVDTIMADRAVRWTKAEAELRHERAVKWVQVRRYLKLLPDAQRHAFLEYYYRVRFPLDPGYMQSVLRTFLDGRLVYVDGVVKSKAELDFKAERSAKISRMTEEELLRAIQSPYASGDYLDELRAERQRRQS